jgi:hypothetical protein
VELEVLREVPPRDVEWPAARRGFFRDDRVDVCQPLALGALQAERQVAEARPTAGHPDGKDERQPRELLPRLAEVELVR